MKTSILCLFSLLLSAGSQYAQGQDTLADIVPPEYRNIPKVDLILSRPGENPVVTRAKCNNGVRIGDALGRQFVQRVKPSCDELLLSAKPGEDNEWVVPNTSYSKTTDAASVCTYMGFSQAVSKTILNTAVNCAKQLDDSFLLVMQIEYNKCYKDTAQKTVSTGMSFGTGFITGEYVVIPPDTEAWDNFLIDMAAIANSSMGSESSGFKQYACQIAVSHATRGVEPVNFFAENPFEEGNKNAPSKP